MNETASGGGPQGEYRDQRRRMLMDNVASTIGGLVFCHVVAHAKGRRSVANILKRLFAPQLGPAVPAGGAQCAAQGLPVLLLVLEHAKTLFVGNVWPAKKLSRGAVPEQVHIIEATVAIAVHAVGAISQMQRPEEVVECLEAFVASDVIAADPDLLAAVEQGGSVEPGALGTHFVMPLCILQSTYLIDTGNPWLGSILTALLQRAAALQLTSGGSAAGGEEAGVSGAKSGGAKSIQQRFNAAFSRLFACFSLHLMSLKVIMETVAGDIAQQGLLLQLLAQDVATAIVAASTSAREERLRLLLEQLCVEDA